VHITSSISGGSGSAAKGLNDELLKLGIDSQIITLKKYRQYIYSNKKKAILFFFRKLQYKIKRKILSFFFQFPSNYFTFPFSEFKELHKHPTVQEADIIHLHWVGNFVDIASFFPSLKKKLVWTLHDLNPITAGFHCLPSKSEITKNSKFINRMKNEKLKYIPYEIINFVYTSSFVKELINQKSFFLPQRTTFISLGIRFDKYKPMDKNEARKLLHISSNKKMILFIADTVEDPWKNFDFAVKVLENIANDNIILGIVGNIRTKKLLNHIKSMPTKYLYFGHVNDKALMSKIYSAADVYISTSKFESFGQTVLESLACGIPVIGFPIGVIPDVIINEYNGYICNQFNINTFSETISKALNQYWNKHEIRKNVKERYEKSIEAKNYKKLYESLQLDK